MTGAGAAGLRAQLRVYEPLAAFPGPERERWASCLASGRGMDRQHGAGLERSVVLRALAGPLPELPADDGRAWVTEVDGIALVSPWRLRVRAAEALADFSADLHDDLVDAFVPRAVAERASEELDAWRQAHPDLRTHVLDSPWQVPLRWFLLVDPEERSVSLGEGSVRTGRELVYRTAMSRARRRVARALAVLRRSVEDGEVVQGVEDLGRWLEEFHPRALVELDYGGLVHLVGDAELLQDESARDVGQALAALGEGRLDDAGVCYARVTARMKALQAVESSN